VGRLTTDRRKVFSLLPHWNPTICFDQFLPFRAESEINKLAGQEELRHLAPANS